MSTNSYPVGTAPIKKEFIVSFTSRPAADDDAAEGGSTIAGKHARSDSNEGEGAGENNHQDKKVKLSGAQRRKLSKEEKKKQRGSNKGRRWGKVHEELDLCWRFADTGTCEFGEKCRYSHDISAYLTAKPKDIYLPLSSELSESPPFVRPPQGIGESESSVDPLVRCPVYEEIGSCRHGLKCRFLGGHANKSDNGHITVLKDEKKNAEVISATRELNFMTGPTLKLLRTKKYPLPVTERYLKELQQSAAENGGDTEQPRSSQTVGVDQVVPTECKEPANIPATADAAVPEPAPTKSTSVEAAAQMHTPDVPLRAQEKNRLNWQDKTYLAPLTTVGNLPFRRLCVDLGADITCGEMGLATSFLAGSKEEWSLVRRHPSEKMFGVQVAGSKPALLVPTAEVIGRECAGVDFVDLNCGCPIDLVFKAGSGSALLDAPGKLGRILIGMNQALGEIPLTVKLRTGVKEGKNTSHKLMPRISREWNVAAMTLHGRTRQQRYTKLADWDYIKQCVDGVRALEEEHDMPRVPIFGGGDCYSAQDYWDNVTKTGVDGVMVARGALIKPWIFTEIKERREWDISSRERLDGLRKYAEYGLDHFGTDTAGVNTTRRYLCEAISFQYRYVPLGLLEHIPGRINDRAPLFRGRDELETLLASPDSRDWVKISEMFLGPAPDGWMFTPKHKSNAYGSEEGQG